MFWIKRTELLSCPYQFVVINFDYVFLFQRFRTDFSEGKITGRASIKHYEYLFLF